MYKNTALMYRNDDYNDDDDAHNDDYSDNDDYGDNDDYNDNHDDNDDHQGKMYRLYVTSTVFLSDFESSYPAVRPAGPAPIITTSYFFMKTFYF